MIVETANNEGWNFVLVLKPLDRGDFDVSPTRWVKLMNTLFESDADKILEVYACPCYDETDITCECRVTADTFLTDYTWYCNIRYAITKGYELFCNLSAFNFGSVQVYLAMNDEIHFTCH